MVILIDNYDSFTYNLVQRLGEIGCRGIEVFRNDKITVAEVEAHDNWQRAVLGVACVSASSDYAHGLLQAVANAVEHWRLDCEVVDYDIELLT